ncbi:MAG: TIGR02147 family protein [Fibrobacterota bacterium]
MESIYHYSNYRQYLFDFYADKKKGGQQFSFKLFAKTAGFKSKSFVCDIILGRRNLSKKSTLQLSGTLDLNHHEMEFFETLVLFNQSSSAFEKKYFQKKLNRLNIHGIKIRDTMILHKDQYDYFSAWHYSAIRSIVDMHEFRDNYAWLANKLRPSIHVAQAQKAIVSLEKLGLIKRREDGVYRVTHKNIATDKETDSTAIQNFHASCALLGIKALKEFPRNQRFVSGVTLGISETTYKEICARVDAFLDELMVLAEADCDASRTYQFSTFFFPFSD